MSKLRNELDKLSGLIVGKNTLQSPLDFWGRYDVWREAVKGLEKAIKRMEEKMERLTHERVNGIKTGYWSPEKKETLVNALAEYENTGLTPEEIKMLNGKGADAPANDGWIPVEERLPEEKKSVLVQWEKYDRHLNVTLTYLDVMWLDDAEEKVFETINGVPNGKVIAWRPLPEPYSPERSNNHDDYL